MSDSLPADFVGPWWLERLQAEVVAPDRAPGEAAPELENLDHRSATLVGNLASPHRPLVDQRGLVVPESGRWSIDWWIGADDRWHLPSREVAVRQRLIETAPVVETSMRIPSGDAVQRAFTMRGAGDRRGEYLIVEIENQSPVPVALAVALRPYDLDGLTEMHEIELRDRVVVVDGRAAVSFPKPPARVAGGNASVDSAAVVVAGEAPARLEGPVRCPEGRAQAAFVIPLPHTAVVRLVVPLDDTGRAGVEQPAPLAVPDARAVAKGWEAHGGRGVRVDLPDTRLAEAVDAARRSLLLADTGAGLLDGSHRGNWTDAEGVVAAFDCWGYEEEAAAVLATLPAVMDRHGYVGGDTGRLDANGGAMAALGGHALLSSDAGFAEAAVEVAASAALWVRRRIRRARRRGSPGDLALGDGGAPPELSGPGPTYWDQLWTASGLDAVAALLDRAGQTEAAAEARADAKRVLAPVHQNLQGRAAGEADAPPAARPGEGPRAGSVADLIAVRQPTMTDESWLAATRSWAGSQVVDGAVLDPRGTGGHAGLTLLLGMAELDAGDPVCLERLDWVLGAASPTWTWSEVSDPATDRHFGRSVDHRVTAAVLRLVRDLLVREVGGGLDLCSMWPGRWFGQGVEVHGAPTVFGRFSYAVRWHGDRPALLWELDPVEGTGPVRLRVPGLDPRWESSEPRGEALLGCVAPPSSVSASGRGRPRDRADRDPSVDEGDSFG